MNYTYYVYNVNLSTSISHSIWTTVKNNELGNVGQVTLPFAGELSVGLTALVPYLATLHFTSSFKCCGSDYSIQHRPRLLSLKWFSKCFDFCALVSFIIIIYAVERDNGQFILPDMQWFVKLN
jgi:hypothetical protein